MFNQPSLFPTPQQITTSDDYYTPKWIFDALQLTFDLDVAAPPNGGPFVPCRSYFTQAENGLAQPWEGLVWMNPPFSKPAPWVQRFVDHQNGVALLFASTSRWFMQLWNSEAKWLAIKRVAFVRPDGTVGGQLPLPLYLIALGDQGITALQNCNLGTVR